MEEQQEEPVEHQTVQATEQPAEESESPHGHWPRNGVAEVSRLSQTTFLNINGRTANQMSSSSLDDLGPELYQQFTLGEKVSHPECSLGGQSMESLVSLSEPDDLPNDEHEIGVNVIPPKSAINNVQLYSDICIPVSVASIGHHVYNGLIWVKQAVENHPVGTNLHLKLDKSGYNQFGKTIPTQPNQLNVYGLADSGAQMCVISPEMAR